MSMLKVEHIDVFYGAIHAIKDISFEVNEGEIVTLIGANGAGKSTTLKTVSAMMRPKNGTIEFLGHNMTTVAPHKIGPLGMAHCPEGRRIFQQMTVRENLEMGAYTRPNSEVEDSIEDIYQRFPRLKERYKQVAGTLSGGEQQMLAVGRALMGKPKMMLMDEPSMGLSPLLVKEIFEIIKEVNKQGITILLVEQNAKMALAISDRAYVLETGTITIEGDAQQLLNDPRVKKAYLGQ